MKKIAGIIIILLASFGAGFWCQGAPRVLDEASRPAPKANEPSSRITNQLKSTPTRALNTPTVETIRISGDQAGNKRYPGVAENGQGDRLVIYRSGDSSYWYSFFKKGGTWSSPKQIPGQPSLDDYTCVDVAADSTGRFHCVWEEPDEAVVYGSCRDGNWTTPFKLPLVGRDDMGVSIAVRSNDEVIIANSMVVTSGGLTKDIFFWYKGKTASKFTPDNMMDDPPSSTQPAITVDANDHIWLGYKTEPRVGSDWLDVRMVHYDQNNKELEWKTISDPDLWNFWPQVAVNSDGKVMFDWACSQMGDYQSRLYDPSTKRWTELINVNLGIPVHPWCEFWTKLVSHGQDFYLAAMNSGRGLSLLKFNFETSRWDNVARISSGGVETFDLYSGYDKMLIAWDDFREPTNVYLTTVSVEPYSSVRIQSVANLKVEKKVERGFFHGYYLNSLTWEANPENTEREVVVTAQRVYRKGASEDDGKWVKLAEVAATVRTYADRNIAADANYVYAVTCVDDSGNESRVY